GSFSGSFTLPDKIDGTEVAIVWEDFILKHLNVEEYKRPSFEIKTNDINHCYTFGDKVELSGTISYLTGIPVANAKVAYQITQEYYRNYESEAISSDTIHTDSYGKFKLSFTPHCDDPKENTAIYYCVKLTATDLNGETQSSNYSFLIGTKPIFLSMDFNISEEKQLLLMEELNKAVVQAKNTSGNNIDTDITVEVAQSGKVIAKEIVKPNKTNSFTHFDTKKWESGSYKVTLTAKDEKGRIAKREYDIVLYRKTDPRPATHQELMVIKDFSDEINWGDTLHFRIGSSLMGQHAKYIIEDTNGIKEEQELLLNNEFKDVFYPFSSQNGERLKISILLINNHIEYQQTYDCRKGKENKQLDLELTSFRDKTTPGSHEKWTISVKEKEHPAEIAVLAYDKSLDLLLRDDEPEFYRGFYWNFSTEEEETIHSEWSFQDRINSYCYFHEENKKKTSGYREWNFDSFLKIPFHGSKIHGSEMEFLAFSCEEECIEEEIDPSSTSTPPPPPPGIKNENILMEEETSSMSTNVNLRKNFAETAFFYPHLKTNESGKATFEFTVPDQLTTWKFQAFAHTKDLHAGRLEKVFICRKEFFITPNLPRFVRQGDLCCFSAKVSNLSSKEMSGKAILEIKNLASKKLIEKKEVPFHLSANKTDAVKWTVKIPDDLDMIEVKTIVQSGSQTDGEVSQLPVLSDRTLVTQSLPLTIRGNQTKSFTFNQLKQNQSDTRQDKALTLEFCSNPIWYAVAALPSIATPEEECSICLSHAYYCSVLAQGIANSHPSIAKTIQAWKNEGDESALHSELEKNPQLKNILLAESPWVADAQREKRQRQELSFLFDTQKQQENRQRLLERLNHLRNPNGAYTWFNGMIESRHITLQVLEEMGRLRQLYPDLFSKEEMTKYQQSLQYLDKKLKEDFEDLRRANPRDYNKTTYISMDKLRLFYVHTLYPEFPIAKGCQEAYEFFQKRIDIDWLKRSLYGQALTAIILQRNGEKKTARRIINSLREHSSSDETMGMYWEGNVAGYFWHESTIATQALLIEAFQEIDPQTKELDNLRIWLLNQKRTQRWENETETIQALYALLLTGTDWLGDENKAHISMGGKEIKPQKEMVGTGYFTHDFEAKEITPALADISVKKEGKSLAWGAVYWQFTEKMEKVESSKNEIEIKKTMTIERNVNNRKVLEPITDKTKLKVGDKLVIRLVIKSQREMEYVTLKDQKPACLEPTEQISGYHWDNKLSYYQIQKDASMNFFFEYIPKGTFVVEYPLWVTHAGEFTNGIATLQCLYAPAFVANSKGTEKLNIAKE
ncbi:MAG: hypothetical protein J6Y37_13535, partial [Paludibacteraceae bacterium]|nr:hypothetical protein [Paludibacteraceae bacterium]